MCFYAKLAAAARSVQLVAVCKSVSLVPKYTKEEEEKGANLCIWEFGNK